MYLSIYHHILFLHLYRYEFSDCHFQNNSAAFGGALSTVQVYSQVRCFALYMPPLLLTTPSIHVLTTNNYHCSF